MRFLCTTLALKDLKEHYRIGFAIKKVAGCVSTLCNPSGSRENSENLIAKFALHRCQNTNE